ncbi:Uncharacterised protein [Chromobacterium violaceum]|uniref:Uncharacterized protein n=1 Tax=Chromobacterium violaceum TaxID=536 RepID=A0A3S4HNB6_CHRVL|nr:Uncharacterised protein [Chromobacterium violaceum]
MAEVLALEQGDTDKLTEYSPRQLLDLVFQVFGDKDVLDNYQRAATSSAPPSWNWRRWAARRKRCRCGWRR